MKLMSFVALAVLHVLAVAGSAQSLGTEYYGPFCGGVPCTQGGPAAAASNDGSRTGCIQTTQNGTCSAQINQDGSTSYLKRTENGDLWCREVTGRNGESGSVCHPLGSGSPSAGSGARVIRQSGLQQQLQQTQSILRGLMAERSRMLDERGNRETFAENLEQRFAELERRIALQQENLAALKASAASLSRQIVLSSGGDPIGSAFDDILSGALDEPEAGSDCLRGGRRGADGFIEVDRPCKAGEGDGDFIAVDPDTGELEHNLSRPDAATALASNQEEQDLYGQPFGFAYSDAEGHSPAASASANSDPSFLGLPFETTARTDTPERSNRLGASPTWRAFVSGRTDGLTIPAEAQGLAEGLTLGIQSGTKDALRSLVENQSSDMALFSKAFADANRVVSTARKASDGLDYASSIWKGTATPADHLSRVLGSFGTIARRGMRNPFARKWAVENLNIIKSHVTNMTQHLESVSEQISTFSSRR